MDQRWVEPMVMVRVKICLPFEASDNIWEQMSRLSLAGPTINTSAFIQLPLPSNLLVEAGKKNRDRCYQEHCYQSHYQRLHEWHSVVCEVNYSCNLSHAGGDCTVWLVPARAWWWTALWPGLCSWLSFHHDTPAGLLWSAARWCLNRGHRPPRNACVRGCVGRC